MVTLVIIVRHGAAKTVRIDCVNKVVVSVSKVVMTVTMGIAAAHLVRTIACNPVLKMIAFVWAAGMVTMAITVTTRAAATVKTADVIRKPPSVTAVWLGIMAICATHHVRHV